MIISRSNRIAIVLSIVWLIVAQYLIYLNYYSNEYKFHRADSFISIIPLFIFWSIKWIRAGK